MQIIREIAKKVAQIQNGMLSRSLCITIAAVAGKGRDWKFITTWMIVTDFRLSQWLTVDVTSLLEWFHLVNLGKVADILEIHATSIFWVRIRREASSTREMSAVWPTCSQCNHPRTELKWMLVITYYHTINLLCEIRVVFWYLFKYIILKKMPYFFVMIT
jgi:hypothetical protein